MHTNRLLLQEIERRNNGHFIDIFSAMRGQDGRPNISLFLEDGLHVGPKGYQVWKKLLFDRSGELF